MNFYMQNEYPHDEPASKMSYPSLVFSNDHIVLQKMFADIYTEILKLS